MTPEELRKILDNLREFRNGESWEEARMALVSRLAELGALDKAQSASQAFWPEVPPAQVSYSLWKNSVDGSKELLLQRTIHSAITVQDRRKRTRLLGCLLPQVPEGEKAGIESEIAFMADSMLTDSPLGEVDEELVQILLGLPKLSLLGVWHRTMRRLATFDRKDMLIALPPLLCLGSLLSQGQIWSDVATAIRAVHKRWR
jgi:hypothetical protein